MDADKYLERIEYKKNLKADFDTLKQLHINHLYKIPFENLDIHNNKKIVLELKKVENKVLNNSRGGYCYELNGLFYFLLKELGYKVKLVSARVSNGKGDFGEEFDHLGIIAEIDNAQWLVDVGFGDSFIEPVLIELDKPQLNLNGWFKIVKHDDNYLKLVKSFDNNLYGDEYIFTLKERNWNEFEGMNHYHQTSPESPFTQKKLCTIAKDNGRITLTNDKLTITEDDERKISEVKDEKEFNEMLYKYFKIRL